jgi:hypothetical protein
MDCSAIDHLESSVTTHKPVKLLLLQEGVVTRYHTRIRSIESSGTGYVFETENGSIPEAAVMMVNDILLTQPFADITKEISRLGKSFTPSPILTPSPWGWKKADLSRYNPVVLSGRYGEYLDQLTEKQELAAWGGYLEDRHVYAQHALFCDQEEARSIHLGIDIWAPAGYAVCAPVSGTIHSFQDNAGPGNYGPTVILEHHLQVVDFFSLYGHLSRESLIPLKAGYEIAAGEVIGHIGTEIENGNWLPHLHFQVMASLVGNTGDFPGVCTRTEAPFWAGICPDPWAFTGIPA